MPTYINGNTDTNITSSTGVKPVSATKQMIAEVKSKITIPMYFYSIIVPQLGSYYDNYPVNFDVKPVACCPLHDEDTPSCRYYPETNSFYCFGCSRGGDVVWLHRYFVEKQTGTLPDYDTAIAFLYTYFIEGKETQVVIDTTVHKESLNSDSDIVRLNLYRYNLESSITFDNSVKDEAKKEIWDTLDKIDMLLSKNLIKADDAIDYIKNKVKEVITVENTENTESSDGTPRKMLYKSYNRT